MRPLGTRADQNLALLMRCGNCRRQNPKVEENSSSVADSSEPIQNISRTPKFMIHDKTAVVESGTFFFNEMMTKEDEHRLNFSVSQESINSDLAPKSEHIFQYVSRGASVARNIRVSKEAKRAQF